MSQNTDPLPLELHASAPDSSGQARLERALGESFAGFLVAALSGEGTRAATADLGPNKKHEVPDLQLD